MKTICLYFITLIPLSVLLAVFEIWLEGYKKGSWGKTEFDHPFWGRKIRTPILLDYITSYHIVAFSLIVIPIVIVSVGLYGVGARSLLFGSAIFIGNMGFEDFLWFAIQSLTGWREPQALQRVLAGNFDWHTSWLPLPFGKRFPAGWAIGMIGAALLLALTAFTA